MWSSAGPGDTEKSTWRVISSHIAENCCAVRQGSDLPATVAVLMRETREEWRKCPQSPESFFFFIISVSTPHIYSVFIMNILNALYNRPMIHLIR